MASKVTVDEVRERIAAGDGITIVDARSEDAWNTSPEKAEGAIRIPPDRVEEHLAEIDRDAYVVTYCT